MVSNAGVSQAYRLMDSSQSDYDLVMDASVRGAYNMSRAVVSHFRLRQSGAIVCIGSVAAQRGGGILGGQHYSAAKGAVQMVRGNVIDSRHSLQPPLQQTSKKA